MKDKPQNKIEWYEVIPHFLWLASVCSMLYVNYRLNVVENKLQEKESREDELKKALETIVGYFNQTQEQTNT